MGQVHSTLSVILLGIVALGSGLLLQIIQEQQDFIVGVLVQLGITVSIIGCAALIMLRRDRSSFRLAMGSAMTVTVLIALIYLALGTLFGDQLWRMHPFDISSYTWVFTCWGVSVAFALGLADRPRNRKIAVTSAVLAVVPLIWAIGQAVTVRTATVATEWIYPVILVTGLGLCVAIPLFHLGTAVKQTTNGRSRSSRPIWLSAIFVCSLQSVAIGIGLLLHMPSLSIVGAIGFLLFTVGPVLYIGAGLSRIRHTSIQPQ